MQCFVDTRTNEAMTGYTGQLLVPSPVPSGVSQIDERLAYQRWLDGWQIGELCRGLDSRHHDEGPLPAAMQCSLSPSPSQRQEEKNTR